MNVVLIFINQLFCKDEYEIFEIYLGNFNSLKWMWEGTIKMLIFGPLVVRH